MDHVQVLSQIHGEKCWPVEEKLSPCQAACPIHTDVPSYVMAIAQGKFKEALAVIREVNPFPSVCGRVCHHPCEEVCNRGKVDQPIAIQWLKRRAADTGLEERPAPAMRTHKERVAVIGSGPAGLTAAYDLTRKGYRVTVYESQPIPGGMLTMGIPEFILPRPVALAEIAYIQALGVDIRTRTALGRDFSLDDLWAMGMKAILLALGNQGSAMLPLPGADLKGIHPALPFLKRVRLGDPPPLKGKVVVIGGGNVAMDVARTALRLGAAEVHVACLEARKGMPAFPWEVEATERERVRLHPSLAPQEFRSEDGVHLSEVLFRRVASTVVDREGRISWTLLQGPGSELSMETDAAIIAVGQYAEIPFGEPLHRTARETILVDPRSMATNIPGLFAAGDSVRVGGTVIDAIADGHRAARAMECYLQALPAPDEEPSKEVVELDPNLAPGFFQRRERWAMPALPAQDAIRCFQEVYLGYPEWMAVQEARRCLNCRSCIHCIFEREQVCYETASRLISARREG